MNQSHIPGFPNIIPIVYWLTYLPILKYEKKDNAALHLVRFHMHVHKFRVEFLEHCVMKMFMATLKDEARTLYEGLYSGSLFSMKYFHRMFFEHYEKSHYYLSLLQYCCHFCEVFIPYLKNLGDNGDFLDEYMLEELYEFSSQQPCQYLGYKEEHKYGKLRGSSHC